MYSMLVFQVSITVTMFGSSFGLVVAKNQPEEGEEIIKRLQKEQIVSRNE